MKDLNRLPKKSGVGQEQACEYLCPAMLQS
jgi:hypothetical protein